MILLVSILVFFEIAVIFAHRLEVMRSEGGRGRCGGSTLLVATVWGTMK